MADSGGTTLERILSGLSVFTGVLTAIQLAGAAVLAYLGLSTLRARPGPVAEGARTGAVYRGILANAINPHPWVFWTLVGGPILHSAWENAIAGAFAFLGAFYGAMVGSKVALAWLVSRQAGGLSLIWYRRILGVCGLALLIMGGWLIWQTWSGG